MPNLTVSANIDTFMGSANNAAARANLGAQAALTTAAPLALELGGTGAITASAALSALGAVAKAGDTMTGKLALTNGGTTAPLNLGAQSNVNTLTGGDVWINSNGVLSWRTTAGATIPAVTTSSATNFTAGVGAAIGSAVTPALVVAQNGANAAMTVANVPTSTADCVTITNLGTGNTLVVNDETPDSTRFAIASNGKVGIGVAPDATAALTVDSGGIKFPDSSIQTSAIVSLSSAQVSGLLGISNGGTGAATSSAALNALLPTQAANNGKFLYTDGATASWAKTLTFAQTKTVGVDAATIQGCIDLVSGATGLNQTQILIPPGVYTENLTLKPCVSLASTGGNNGQGSVVRIVGVHTATGSATAGDSVLEINGIRFENATTSATITFSANGTVPFLVHMQDCMVGNSNASTAVSGVVINSDVAVRAVNIRSIANATAGSGGTHWDLNGGSLYSQGCSTEYGTCALLMRGTNGASKPYAELRYSYFNINGSNVVNITSATALLTAGWCSFENRATTGNGITIAAGSVVGVFNSAYVITAGASNYVVTGSAGSFYFSSLNSYSNSSLIPYETKIGASVAQYAYSTTIGTVAGPTVIEASSASPALRITQQTAGTGNALVVEDENNPDSTPFIVNNSGQVLCGNATSIALNSVLTKLQTHTTANTPLDAASWWSGGSGTTINLGKSRSGTVGTNGIVSANDNINLDMRFDKGDGFASAAIIRTSVDGAPSSNSMPGKIALLTTPSGSTTPVSRVTIAQDGATEFSGKVGIGTTPDATVGLKLDSTGVKFSDGSVQTSGYFTGSATYDPPSLIAGASTTTTVTCTGALTTHYAQATLSSNTGLTITAYVSAANTVTVQLKNDTLSTLDVASGTLKVRSSL
jgi:hypothetical protein